MVEWAGLKNQQSAAKLSIFGMSVPTYYKWRIITSDDIYYHKYFLK